MVWRRRFLESKPSCLRTLDPLSVFLSVLPSCPPLLFWKVILHCWSLPLEGRDGGGQPGSTLAVALGPPPPQPRRRRPEPGPASGHPHPEPAHSRRSCHLESDSMKDLG